MVIGISGQKLSKAMKNHQKAKIEDEPFIDRTPKITYTQLQTIIASKISKTNSDLRKHENIFKSDDSSCHVKSDSNNTFWVETIL